MAHSNSQKAEGEPSTPKQEQVETPPKRKVGEHSGGNDIKDMKE
jgi:hypothetical protein